MSSEINNQYLIPTGRPVLYPVDKTFKRFSDYIHGPEESSSADILIFGVPYDGSMPAQWQTVSKEGPTVLRDILCLMRTYCNEIGVDFSQILKIADIGNLDVLYNTQEVSKRIADLTASIVSLGKIPLMLGGEHMTTAGALSGVSQAVNGNIGVIYFDAHLDFDDELYGQKWYNGCPFRRAMELDNIKPENLVGIGIRGFIDFPKNQWDYAKKNNITIFTMDDIDELGIKEVTRRAIKIAQKNTDVVYSSIDIDVLDPSMAPCSLFHAPGGMTTRELITSVRMISQIGLVGFDVTEVSTSNDPGKLTASPGASCIAEFIGSTAKYFQTVNK